jgi:hypothetical protein
MKSNARFPLVPVLAGSAALALLASPVRAVDPPESQEPFPGICGTTFTPAQGAAYLQSIQDPVPPTGGGEPEPPYYIPIAAHIIRHSDGTGGLPESRLADAIDDANFHYASVEMIFYRLGDIDYIDSDEWYSTETLEEIDQMRTTNLVPDAVNIYFTENLDSEFGSLCGISAFTFSDVQSIALRNSCTANPAGLGNHSTFSHEVGHYFDLFHTHETFYGAELVDGSNCDVAGDLVCDTPADPTLSGGNVSTECLYTGSAVDGNGDPYEPDPTQLMSYSLKHCRDNFTTESLDRAVTTLVTLRPDLITNVVAAPEIAVGGGTPADAFAVSLSAPHPTPTRGATRIAFTIERSGPVDLSVHDVRGARVKTIVRATLDAGSHEEAWDGAAGSGVPIAAGVYFVHLRTESGSATRKVQIVR